MRAFAFEERHFRPLKCGQPHETTDSFAPATSFVGCIQRAECLEILVVKPCAIDFYQKAAYLTM
jgi:hypothetical protein